MSEAHPDDEWQLESNREDEIVINQPRAFAERKDAAKILVERLHYDLPLALDGMENRAEAAFAAWPERLYVVGKGGRIVYRGGVGPFGFDTREMERSLAALVGPPSPSPPEAAVERRPAEEPSATRE